MLRAFTVPHFSPNTHQELDLVVHAGHVFTDLGRRESLLTDFTQVERSRKSLPTFPDKVNAWKEQNVLNTLQRQSGRKWRQRGHKWTHSPTIGFSGFFSPNCVVRKWDKLLLPWALFSVATRYYYKLVEWTTKQKCTRRIKTNQIKFGPAAVMSGLRLGGLRRSVLMSSADLLKQRSAPVGCRFEQLMISVESIPFYVVFQEGENALHGSEFLPLWLLKDKDEDFAWIYYNSHLVLISNKKIIFLN